MRKATVGAVGWLLVTLLHSGVAWGGTATLSWDANIEPALAGYRVHYGTSRAYANSMDVGRVTTYTMNGLTEKATYYFVVTAYNQYGSESGYSNEVSKTIPDTMGPVVSSRTASPTTSTTAVITWLTNEPATTQVEYGASSAYGMVSPLDSTLVTSHRVTLTGLTPSTIYHFRVASQDVMGNSATTGDATWAQTDYDPWLGSADLSVTMSDGPDPATVGQRVTYTIVAANNGPNTATDVTMTDVLPAGVTFWSVTASQGTCGGVNAMTCSLGNLASGARATVTLVVTITAQSVAMNTASLLSRVTDPNLVNNTVTTTTNAGSALVNLSSRLRVLTADNVGIGGFIIQGSSPKTILLRARGPSMGGAPFNLPGVLANPFLQLYSGSTVMAQNNDWQTADPLCLNPATECGNAAQIVTTGLDPCQPNPGQTGAPPGCSQESAILITLPPGNYGAIVSGVSGGTGVGLVEVFEVGSATSRLINISTRAFVETGDNVEIGGFTIGGTDPKTVLIRARGPSMGGAPFNVPATLANPLVQLYSFASGTYIAQNDNWQVSDPLCAASGLVCGGATEISATGLDPCIPNPAQPTAPPGCSQEAAILITLPPGNYGAIVSGVSGGTGVGLMEVFEVSP
jgi:uncharacterized repeat protein (TIGR01451 family)